MSEDTTKPLHTLKCWPEPFLAIREKRKTWEFRLDDGRHFAEGDFLLLNEYVPPDPEEGTEAYFTGDWILVRVGYLSKLSAFVPLSEELDIVPVGMSIAVEFDPSGVTQVDWRLRSSLRADRS